LSWQRPGEDQGPIVASVLEVRANLAALDQERLVFVKGKVEDTVPREAPDRIALFRVDTDWCDSTLHELTHLGPAWSQAASCGMSCRRFNRTNGN